MADHVEQFIDSLNVHYLHQCSREELGVLADRFGVKLTAKLKQDMQKELVMMLTEKGLLCVEEQHVHEGEQSELETSSAAVRWEMSGSERYILERMKLEVELKKAEVEIERSEKGDGDLRGDSEDKEKTFICPGFS